MFFCQRTARFVLLCLAGFAGGLAWSQQPLSLQQLRAGFLAPPPAAKLRCYWWWLNGNTDKATITHDLEEMKAKGFGGALLVDAGGADQEGNQPVPAGPTFGSPAWVELYTHALREADRLGLEITLNITSGWNLGGPSVTPEQASKLLTWSVTDTRGGATEVLKLPVPAIKNGFYRQIAVLAYPLMHGAAYATQPGALPADTAGGRKALPTLKARSAAAEAGFSMPDTSAMLIDTVAGEAGSDVAFADASSSQVQNITTQVAPDGTVQWVVPAGEWEILRIGYTDSDARVSTGSGAWKGLAIDYMSRASFEAYWNQVVEPLMTAAKPFHSLKYLATDSWELGGTNWTQDFREQFQQRRGYDPVPWLPIVAGRIIGSRDQSTRFLTDLRRTIADLVVAGHYDVFAEKAQQHGMGVEAESGGPHGAPIDALETFRHASVPQTEFWSQNSHRDTDKDRFFTKEAASAAHIYGQPLVAQEGETSIGPQWSESLAADLKPSFDMGITEGMNRLVWHEFTSSPAATGLPGQEYFAGTHVDPKVTWFNAGGAFFTYLNRAQFMMQQGTAVDDVLYFAGDNVPSFVRLKADDPAHVLPGYDYDVTNEDALLRTIRVEDHELVGPSGVRWRVLVMPTSQRVSLAALERVATLIQQGATVIGRPPTSPTGMATKAEFVHFNRLVTEFWGGACNDTAAHPHGQGQVVCSADTRSALGALHILPDVILSNHQTDQVATSTSRFDFVHRRVGDTDIYFIRNGTSQESDINAIFRANGKAPRLWNPVTGETNETPDYQSLPDGRVRLQMLLPAYGSSFVVFTERDAPSYIAKASRSTVAISTLRPWTVTFQPSRGAPTQPVVFQELKNWADSADSGIRYFSGTATYRADVAAPPTSKDGIVRLAFTSLHEIARVRVNGHDAGTVWAQPLMLRVDPWLHPGKNTLEIEVTNLWPNRIIGDLQPGVTQRFTQTNITKYKADSPLLPSGLIGPVEWMIEQ